MPTNRHSATNPMSVKIYRHPYEFLNTPPMTASHHFINLISDKCQGDVQLVVRVRRHWTTDLVNHSGLSNSMTQSIFVKTFFIDQTLFWKKS